MSWVAACEDCGEDVEEAVGCGEEKDDVEKVALPARCEDAEEEETETDFEGCGGEDVEYFGELDILLNGLC